MIVLYFCRWSPTSTNLFGTVGIGNEVKVHHRGHKKVRVGGSGEEGNSSDEGAGAHTYTYTYTYTHIQYMSVSVCVHCTHSHSHIHSSIHKCYSTAGAHCCYLACCHGDVMA